jgi:hypothetical protein
LGRKLTNTILRSRYPGSNPARIYIRFLGKTYQCCCVNLTKYALFACWKGEI